MRILLKYQKIRFLMVGGTNTLLDFIMFNILLLFVGLPAVVSNVVTVSISVVISYVLNHYFVFGGKKELTFKAFKRFALITGFSSLAIQTSVIWLFQAVSSSHAVIDSHQEAIVINIAKAIGIGLGMIWNFLFYKHFVFNDKK